MALFALLIVPSVVASGLQDKLEIEQFEVNDIDLNFEDDSEIDEEFERGEELEILLNLEALDEVEDIEVTALIAGDRYAESRRGLTYDFDTYRGTLEMGDAKAFRLNIQIPEDLELDKDLSGEDYKLRIIIADANSAGVYSKDFQLTIGGLDEEKAVRIDDFSFSPHEVVVGRAFTSLVRVENLGDDDIDDLKVIVSVPALNIQDTQYLDSDDELSRDDYQTFEELLLRVPMDAKPGTYEVRVLVEFDKYYETMEKGTITIVEEHDADLDDDEDTSLITATPSQEFAAGTSAVYPVLIENTGKNAKTYALTVTGLSEWATATIEPSSVVNVAGNTKETVLVTVTAHEDATVGEKSFVLSIDTPKDTVQKALTATVTEGVSGTSWGSVQDGLTIGLIVLVIILIILGLIIGFSKLRSSSDKDEEAQTYY